MRLLFIGGAAFFLMLALLAIADDVSPMPYVTPGMICVAGAAILSRLDQRPVMELKFDTTVAPELTKAIVTDEDDWVAAGIPDHAIEAGMAVLEVAEHELRPENYVAGESRDWDNGMIAAAVFKAVGRAILEGTDKP